MTLSQKQRDETRQKILKKASNLLRKKAYHEIKIIDIARELNCSKGNIYRYFKSKEELFLCLYKNEVKLWLDEVPKVFLRDGHIICDQKASLFVDKHTKRKVFMKLQSILNVILEKNLSYKETESFKRFLLEHINKAEVKLCEGNSPLSPFFKSFLFHYNAICVGLFSMANKSVYAKVVFQRNPELKVFDPDVKNELKHFVRIYLKNFSLLDLA